MKLLILNCE